jgi:hypothetical protein
MNVASTPLPTAASAHLDPDAERPAALQPPLPATSLPAAPHSGCGGRILSLHELVVNQIRIREQKYKMLLMARAGDDMNVLRSKVALFDAELARLENEIQAKQELQARLVEDARIQKRAAEMARVAQEQAQERQMRHWGTRRWGIYQSSLQNRRHLFDLESMSLFISGFGLLGRLAPIFAALVFSFVQSRIRHVHAEPRVALRTARTHRRRRSFAASVSAERGIDSIAFQVGMISSVWLVYSWSRPLLSILANFACCYGSNGIDVYNSR